MTQQACIQTLYRKALAMDAARHRMRLLEIARDDLPYIDLPDGRFYHSHGHLELVKRLLDPAKPQTVTELADLIVNGDPDAIQKVLFTLKARGLARIAGTVRAPAARGPRESLLNTWVSVARDAK